MAGFNPFAPQMKQQQQPQMQGVPTPNVAMHDKPSFTETVAPTVLEKAISSDMVGAGADYVQDSVSNAWSALTSPSQYPAGTAPVSTLSNASAAPMAQTVGELSANGLMGTATPSAIKAATNGSLATGIAGGSEAALATQALAAPVATTAAATAAGAAPLALMSGPFAPLVLGGMMVAANSGK